MEGASRRSSVSGLNDSPRTADGPAFQRFQDIFDLLDHDLSLLVICSVDGDQYLRVIPVHLCKVDKRGNILWKAGAAVSYPGVKEFPADALVYPHSVGDLPDIGSHLLADIGDLIDKGYFRGQERIGRILYKLRAFHGGEQHVRVQRSVQFRNDIESFIVGSAYYYPVRRHEIRNRRAFPAKIPGLTQRQNCRSQRLSRAGSL